MAQKLTDAQRAMVEKNLPLVTWYIHHKVPHWHKDEYDDLFQLGALGLCKAAANYDEALGVKFSSYAYHYVGGEIWYCLLRECRRSDKYGHARLEDDAGLGDGITLAHQIPASETGQTVERLLILRDALERLSAEQRRTIQLHIAGYVQTEIAQRLRMSQPSVCRNIRLARARIQRHCAV